MTTTNAGRDPLTPAVELSVVVPFFNEEEAAGDLLREVQSAIRGRVASFEIVAVDDGSADATPTVLAGLRDEIPELSIARLERNSGQGAALLHGLRIARGRLLATMDGDGQNDPADLPALLDRLERAGEEVDMVVGIRAARHDGWSRRAMSRLANAVRAPLLGDGVRDSGCALKVFRREVVGALIPLKTLYSFVPALAVAGGFRVAELPVHHRPRRGGSSSYGLRQFIWWPLVDLVGICWFVRRRSPPVRNAR